MSTREPVAARPAWINKNEAGLVILNPSAGQGRRAEEVHALAQKAGLEPVEPVNAKSARSQAYQASRAGCPLIVAAGGDGTVSAIANGIVEADGHTDLAIIPAGTANDFARSLGIPEDVVQAGALIHSGFSNPIDLVQVETNQESRYVINAVTGGWGASRRLHIDSGIKRRWRSLAYLRTAIEELGDTEAYHCTLELDDETIETDAYAVLACNGRDDVATRQHTTDAAAQRRRAGWHLSGTIDAASGPIDCQSPGRPGHPSRNLGSPALTAPYPVLACDCPSPITKEALIMCDHQRRPRYLHALATVPLTVSGMGLALMACQQRMADSVPPGSEQATAVGQADTDQAAAQPPGELEASLEANEDKLVRLEQIPGEIDQRTKDLLAPVDRANILITEIRTEASEAGIEDEQLVAMVQTTLESKDSTVAPGLEREDRAELKTKLAELHAVYYDLENIEAQTSEVMDEIIALETEATDLAKEVDGTAEAVRSDPSVPEDLEARAIDDSRRADVLRGEAVASAEAAREVMAELPVRAREARDTIENGFGIEPKG